MTGSAVTAMIAQKPKVGSTTPVFVRALGTANTLTQVTTVSLTGTATVGDTIIVAIHRGTKAFTSVTDSGGNTYHQDKATTGTTDGVAIYRATVVTKPTKVAVKFASTPSNKAHICIALYRTAPTTPSPTAGHEATSSPTSVEVSISAATAKNTLIFAVFAHGHRTITLTHGTARQTNTTTATGTLVLGDYNPTNTSAHTIGGSWSTSVNRAYSVVGCYA